MLTVGMRTGYISILQREFQRRRARNPNYSLRAFAAFLGLDSSALSRVFNAKQELSVKSAAHVVRKLRLSSLDQERFIVSVARTRYARVLADLSTGADAMTLKAALRASEEHFRVLFEHMDQLVTLAELVRNDEGEAVDVLILRANPALSREARSRVTELTGNLAKTLLPRLESHWLELFARVVDHKKPEHGEYYSHDLGAWYEVYVESTEDDRFILLARNVTARKRQEEALRFSERRLSAIVNLTPNLLWVVEADGRSIWRNQRWTDYTGQSEAQSADLAWLDAVHPDDRPPLIEALTEAIRSESLLDIESRLRATDGQYRRFLMRAEPVQDLDTKTWHFYCASTVLSEAPSDGV